MSLSILVHDPSALIEEGALPSGFEYAITHNHAGIRCGYIKLLPGHPWHGASYLDLADSAKAHRGLTFSDADEAGGDGWWIGFDCAHPGDAFGWALAVESQRQVFEAVPSSFNFDSKGIVRTTEYVKDELKKLGKQAAEAIALVSR